MREINQVKEILNRNTNKQFSNEEIKKIKPLVDTINYNNSSPKISKYMLTGFGIFAIVYIIALWSLIL